MADQLYIDRTVVRIGEKFSTDFRFVRQSVESEVATFFQNGTTFYHNAYKRTSANGALTVTQMHWAFKIGDYEVRTYSPEDPPFGSLTPTFAPYPANTVVAVSL